MLPLNNFPNQHNPFLEIHQAITQGATPVLVSGLGHTHKAQAIAHLAQKTEKPALLLVADMAEALLMEKDISSLFHRQVFLFTGHQLHLYPTGDSTKGAEQEKLRQLYALTKEKAPIIIATVEALMSPVIPKAILQQAAIKISVGKDLSPQAFTEHLLQLGYTRTQQVEGSGQFALRGGILDLFSPNDKLPLRLEFWGDTLETIASFDPLSQRRGKTVKTAIILPNQSALPHFHPEGEGGFLASLHGLKKKLEKRKEPPTEFLARLTEDIEKLENNITPQALDRYFKLLFPVKESLLHYLPPESLLFCSELGKVSEHARVFWENQQAYVQTALDSGFMEASLAELFTPWKELFTTLTKAPFVVINQFAGQSQGISFSPRSLSSILAKQLPSYGGNLEIAENDIRHYLSTGFSTLVLCKDKARGKKLAELLEKHDIPVSLDLDLQAGFPKPGHCTIGVGNLSGGVEYPSQKLAIITEGQIYQEKTINKKKQKKKEGSLLRFTDLNAGDLVVHEHHGIGRFLGIETMEMDGMKKDYLKISYHGNDKLYLPVTQLDFISKYIGTGGEDTKVKLSRMGGTQWAQAKTKAKGAAKELAKGLIELYAKRSRQKGYAFAPDSPWQREFEEQFPYTETHDQLTCTEDIKRDMEQSMPMDRLLCGDVGYGKTEVALRAIMKCILEGKQAAILVPTTVLAQQHFQTASTRFHGFPVTIEVLSRYKTPGEAKKILERVSKGQVDLLIGTHKILQKSIIFKDLGLLVIDEEQRFGVSHKERLKEMSHNIDVLTLSATPIPRTLNMALSGIRDMSTIEEPPQNRKPVQTYVMEHNLALLADAMRRELNRGGQVYYLHNRVETIDSTALKIRELSGADSVVVAHGKMDEKQLSRAMEAMILGQAQILVCTSIIETGIDIPNVNTLIIEDADRMGLAQLHQIRGRVGRSNRSSFAYLTHRPGKMLTEVAAKRLAAIQEFVAFNSGFKIALRDLEIRGAGNVLGREQSGHMMSVGYDMYLKLLNEAVLEEKGESLPPQIQCTADLNLEANIPAHYVPLPEQRIDLYRRIANIGNKEDAQDVLEELTDRFGKPPLSVLALIDIANLRKQASALGITELLQKGKYLRIHFAPQLFSPQVIVALTEDPLFAKRMKLLPGDAPKAELFLEENRPILVQVTEFVNNLEKHMA